jgi:hypothetical protein
MLGNLDHWLEAATTYAGQKGFEADVLRTGTARARSARAGATGPIGVRPGQYAAAYLSGQKPPSRPDTEKTIAELGARVKTAATTLASFKASAFRGAEQARRRPRLDAGPLGEGHRYLIRVGEPNSTSTSPATARSCAHNGVPLGKQDFIGVKASTDTSDW